LPKAAFSAIAAQRERLLADRRRGLALPAFKAVRFAWADLRVALVVALLRVDLRVADGAELGRVLINAQQNADLDAPPNVRYWG